MRKTKWIFIAIGLMILCYSLIHALYAFVWALYTGIIAGIIVIIVLAYLKFKNRKNKQ